MPIEEILNKRTDRRGLLRAGALAAVALPATSIIGHTQSGLPLLGSEAYGGFAVSPVERRADVSYRVDSAVYRRFDARNTAFGRLTWDRNAREWIAARIREPDDLIESGVAGFHLEDFALLSASWTVANAFESNTGMHGRHAGLFSLDPLKIDMQTVFRTGLDRERLDEQDVTQLVKKAAMFFGASLVGVAPLDERWIYSSSFDYSGERHPIVFTDGEGEADAPGETVTVAEAARLVEGALAEMSSQELREFVGDAVHAAGAASVPAGSLAPGAGHAGIVNARDPEMIHWLVERLGLRITIETEGPSDPQRPRYRSDGTLAIPRQMNRVVVVAFEMDSEAVATYPTPIGAAAAGNAYSRMAFTTSCLAEFIRALGYNAVPCGNMTALSIPMAIDAGLGELGRHGLLITPKYGPRVRLAKVITDMPLLLDDPIRFGVAEFCEVCGKCAANCPGRAISSGQRTMKSQSISTNPGVWKWPVDAVRCLGVWHSLGGSDCGTCIRSCPFNKPDGWLHDATRALIGAESGTLDRVLLSLDDTSGYGEEVDDPERFWTSENHMHVG